MLNRILAMGLMFAGFSLCYWLLRLSDRLSVRVALKTYMFAATRLGGDGQ